MSIDLTQQAIGSEWVTKGGHRVVLLSHSVSDAMVRICDPHVIEGLTYPADARWIYTRYGSFIWSSGLHDRLSPAERDNLKIVGPWVQPTQPVVDENRPVEPAELPQTMINPDIPFPKKKRGIVERFLGVK